jgi:hypothetical protein
MRSRLRAFIASCSTPLRSIADSTLYGCLNNPHGWKILSKAKGVSWCTSSLIRCEREARRGKTHAVRGHGLAYCGAAVGGHAAHNYMSRRFFLESPVPHCPACKAIMNERHIKGMGRTSACGKVDNNDPFVEVCNHLWGDMGDCSLCIKIVDQKHEYMEADYESEET